MSQIPLNKFEKWALILRLLKEGKTFQGWSNTDSGSKIKV
jgi:hypothetical protein